MHWYGWSTMTEHVIGTDDQLSGIYFPNERGDTDARLICDQCGEPVEAVGGLDDWTLECECDGRPGWIIPSEDE